MQEINTEEIIEDLKKADMLLPEKEVLLACCGEDEYGDAKAIINIKMSDVNLVENTEQVLDEIIMDNPIVNVFRSLLNTTVDFTFANPQDYEFINLVGRLNSFMKAEMEPAEDNTLRALFVTITPKEDLVDYFSTGMYGTWFLQPSKVGGAVDTIRFIFSNEFFKTFRIEEEHEEYFADDVESEVKTED